MPAAVVSGSETEMLNYRVKKRITIKLAVSALKYKNLFPASNLSRFSKAIKK